MSRATSPGVVLLYAILFGPQVMVMLGAIVLLFQAPSPKPVGCEDDPVTLAIFSADNTKVKAPAAARVSRICGCSRMVRLSFIPPCTANAAETAPPEYAVAGRQETFHDVHG